MLCPKYGTCAGAASMTFDVLGHEITKLYFAPHRSLYGLRRSLRLVHRVLGREVDARAIFTVQLLSLLFLFLFYSASCRRTLHVCFRHFARFTLSRFFFLAFSFLPSYPVGTFIVEPVPYERADTKFGCHCDTLFVSLE